MIKHIFFDLDHTLWDFDKNAEEALIELYELYKLEELGLNSCTDFISTYTTNNHQLWADYHIGKISKETLRAERFSRTFKQLGIQPDRIPLQFEEDYVRITPTKRHLFAGSEAVLSYLHKKYTLHIISNGFKESTIVKMKGSGLDPYFCNVIISEDVGVNKPNPRIFEYALERANASKNDSIMIGDSIEADIRGAQNFGMKAIFFNPLRKALPDDVSWQIHSLEELMGLF